MRRDRLRQIGEKGLMQPAIAVIGTLRFPPERMPELKVHLKALVEATHRNDGCIAYDVGEDIFDPGLLRFSELWPDAETLAGHLKASHMDPWRKAMADQGLMEREFTVYDLSGARPL